MGLAYKAGLNQGGSAIVMLSLNGVMWMAAGLAYFQLVPARRGDLSLAFRGLPLALVSGILCTGIGNSVFFFFFFRVVFRQRFFFFWGYSARRSTRGIRWLPVIAYSVGWSTETPRHAHGPPADDDHYAAFAAALADRYGTATWKRNPRVPPLPVTTYEVWNEPNLRTFWGGREPDAKRYAALFLTARRALKRADPKGRVIVGGLAGRTGAPTYLRRMYRARPGLRGRVDGVGSTSTRHRRGDLRARQGHARRARHRRLALRPARDHRDRLGRPHARRGAPAHQDPRPRRPRAAGIGLPRRACSCRTPGRPPSATAATRSSGSGSSGPTPPTLGQAPFDVVRDQVRAWQPIGKAPCG